MNGFVVFFGGEALPWLEIEDGRVIGRGEDFQGSGLTVTAVAPASGVTYRVCALGGLSPAQALAAARLDAVDVSLGTDRHVAVGRDGDHYVISDKAKMRAWLAELAERGITASALIPAPSLLPVSESGFVRGALHDETVLRSAETGLAEDGVVSPLVVGDAPVRTLDALELEQAIVASVASPPLNLLQGEFAPRTDWSAGSGYWRRMAILAAVAGAVTLAIPVAQWMRLSISTAALGEQSATIAALALGERSASDDAIERLEDKLADLRGGGAGFLPTLGVVTSAMESMPNTELGALAFDADGTLRATIRATGQPEIDGLGRAIEARGFNVSQGAPRTIQGRAEVEIQVRPQ
jgi:general secretion pathway protein L